MLCYAISFAIMLVVGWQYGLRAWFVAGLLIAAACAFYHYLLIRERDRMRCFAAFRHNNWLGAAIFAGIAMDYLFR
jgi:4-hydroxybenzoate polyprenyltransferase